ncbi:hypothetical protein HAX54_020689, partial [Datura stramonium]|nr:hypothetical protein [Datura stramonium]
VIAVSEAASSQRNNDKAYKPKKPLSKDKSSQQESKSEHEDDEVQDGSADHWKDKSS